MWAICWSIALALLLLTPTRLDAQTARTISNTAQVEWTLGGHQERVPSNTVDLQFAGPSNVVTYLPRDGQVSTDLLATSCASANNPPPTLHIGSDESVEPADRPGQLD